MAGEVNVMLPDEVQGGGFPRLGVQATADFEISGLTQTSNEQAQTPAIAALCMQSLLRPSFFAFRLTTSRRFLCSTVLRRPFHAPAERYSNEASGDMGKEKEKNSFQLKVPKGTKDWEGKDMVIREKIFGNITEVFKRHGAVTIDTLVNSKTSHALIHC